MKKVLQINSVYDFGSTGKIVKGLHLQALREGINSKVIYGRKKKEVNESSKYINSNISTINSIFRSRFFDTHGLSSKKPTQEVIDYIEYFCPDIIHLHNLHGYYINYEILFNYLKGKKIRVVWTLHDCWSFTGHCSHYDFIGCEKWKTECNKCPLKREYPTSYFKDNSKKNYNLKKKLFNSLDDLKIVTPSNWLKEQIESSFFSKKIVGRSETIYNGININKFDILPNDAEFNYKYKELKKIFKNYFVILGIANIWTEKKGFNHFVKLSEHLKEDEIIVLVGLTKKQIKHLPKNIIGFEKTNNVNELVAFYNASDVYVNLTLEEVLGMTNIESLACGTPVITYDSGGSSECIDPSSGYVVQKENLKEVKIAINKVKVNGKLHYSNACRQRAVINYDELKNNQRYLELYK